MKMKLIKTRVNKKSKKSGEKGQALVIVLALMVVGIMIITSTLAFLGTSLKTNKVYINNTNDLYGAEAGIQDGIYNILNKSETQLNGIFSSALNTSYSNTTYRDYDYNNSWTYNLPDPVNNNVLAQVNGQIVSVKVKNIWVPNYGAASTPPATNDEALAIVGGKLIVTGGVYSIPRYTLNVTYSGTTPLYILSIGVWLPQGFTYKNKSSNLEGIYTTEQVVQCAGNQAVIWTFPSNTLFSYILGKIPHTGTSLPIQFDYVTSLQKIPEALGWINVTPNTDFNKSYTWNADIHVYDLKSVAGHTQIETAIPKSATRTLGAAISGDYVAIGNSLMVMGTHNGVTQTQSNDPNGIRYTALPNNPYTLSTIPLDADVQGAFLYWSGFFDESKTMGSAYGERVNFYINNNQVYFDATGKPARGTGAVSCGAPQTDTDPTVGGFSYSCRVDVTKLVQWELVQESLNASHYPGNAKYDVGPAAGSILGVTPDQIPRNSNANPQGCYAGWSLVIIYSSPTTLGHQLYLYDTFSNGQSNSDIDPTTGGKGPGGVISGFIVPAKDPGTQDTDPNGANYNPAVTMTAFVGEGDWCYDGDFLAFNAPQPTSVQNAQNIASKYRLWDGLNLPSLGNTQASPNNVWNSYSQTGLADGVDIKTFHVTWESGLLQPGATSARIDLPTDTDQWNLVYIILSFRSSVTSGGAISYLITHP